MKRIYILLILVAATVAGVSAQSAGMASGLSSKQRKILNRIEANMVNVKGGNYVMGATSEQEWHAYDWEKPAHNVTVADFKIGRYEVTQEEWEAVMGSNPSLFKGARRPVERVSWDDCQQFIAKLNQMTGKTYRLPTEEEWEYAARGGMMSSGATKFAGSDSINNVAWYCHNSDHMTHEVGKKQPNELGLYDMSGNVGEWCDGFCDIARGYATKDPKKTVNRPRRGGNWDRIATFCRNSYRYGRKPDYRTETIGLRLAM